ncbi:MAG TPA: FecR domain-containing protein [Gemmatimonadaceae bacterium]|nr:FecR domain-containing protein [Gemmatimonadaceae bacterium]
MNLHQPSPPPSPDYWEKLGRYVAGESSADEAAEVRRLLAEHPSDAALLNALEGAAVNASQRPEVDVEAALRRVKAHMRAGTSPPSHRSAFARAARGRQFALGAAAVILIALGVTFRHRRGVDEGSGVAATVHATGVGERSTVRLADGTEVMLGPASRISVEGRNVSLTGEAFFRVMHDAAKPFTVRTGVAVIRDVGTAFSVHDDDGAHVRVVVSEGAVQVHAGSDSVQLGRGDVGMLEGARLAAQRGAATAEDLAWTTGKLVFRDASMQDVAADLKRWYGVEVRVTDTALLRRHFTGAFTNESAARVLDVLGLALGARVERRGDTAYFRGRAGGR